MHEADNVAVIVTTEAFRLARRSATVLVRAGATVMFSEVTEVRDAVHLLSARAKDK